MKLLNLLFFLALPVASFAQGTFLFTWHGQSNLFQASFEVTQAEMQPGAPLGSSVFFNSISFTSSLSAVSYKFNSSLDPVGGGLNPWSWGMIIYNTQTGTQINVSGGEPPIGAMQGLIIEHPFQPGQDFYYTEGGYWSFAAVPEPSTAALSTLGILTLIGRNYKA